MTMTPNQRPDVDFESEAELPPAPARKVFEWAGKPLEPFNAGRLMAMQRLGVVGGSVMEAAAAVVRLCQLPISEVVMIRRERCATFLLELGEWMDREAIGIGKPNTEAITDLYADILEENFE
jgi:hypothetical protein